MTTQNGTTQYDPSPNRSHGTTETTEPNDIILRILNSRNFYEVFDIKVEWIEVDAIRRCYKRLALVVHPDKNKSEYAEKAFQLLSDAYECLSNLETQNTYLEKIVNYNRLNQKSKRKNDNNSEFQGYNYFKRKRKQTPEEVWETFRREEELFLAKKAKQEQKSVAQALLNQAKTLKKKQKDQEMQNLFAEQILESSIDEKACNWRNFQGKKGAKPKLDDKRCNSFSSMSQITPFPACLLCKRKFKSVEGLRLHENSSELHMVNLSAYKLI